MIPRIHVATVLLLIACLLSTYTHVEANREKKTVRIDFETLDQQQHPPSGFTTDVTGGGDPGEWVLEAAPPAPHGSGGRQSLVRQTDDKSENRYPHCIYNDFTGRNVDVTVQFMPLSGTVDQAGGIIVRYQDKDNYYVLRANALEGNVRFYKVENGKRTELGGRATAVPKNKWQTLRLVARGRQFEAFLEGVSLFKVEDDTFKDAGKVGLWTKADSVTRFDDLVIVPLED